MTKPIIAADPTETRHLPQDVLAITKIVPGLEELTGADLIISPSPIPFTESTLPIHAKKGVLVQRKKAPDLVASLQDGDSRMWRQIIRMKSFSDDHLSEPWLLIVGDIKGKRVGDRTYAVVDGRESQMNYSAIQGTLNSWQRRGGLIAWLSRDTFLYEWCITQYLELCDREKRGGWRPRYIKRGTVQTIELLSTVETTLCTFPGVGPERAKAIYEVACKFHPSPTLWDCVMIMKFEDVEGIGKKTREGIINYFGGIDGR